MNIKFIPITSHNYDEVKKLHISASQKGNVETVEECCREAEEFSLWHPIAIADGEQLIGFAMYGLWINEGERGRVWLDRFFIDERFQGRGYAKPVLIQLIRKIHEEYGYDEVYLSVYESNQLAIKVYQSLGFAFNGERDINDELVMVLNIKNH